MGSEQALFEPINLDDLSVYADDYRRAAEILDRYSTYLKIKRLAMNERAADRIDNAIRRENQLESIYRGLPEWARW
jgi:hypothetical protein